MTSSFKPLAGLEINLKNEILRREVSACRDIELMRELTMDTLNLMERQRDFFLRELRHTLPRLDNAANQSD